MDNYMQLGLVLLFLAAAITVISKLFFKHADQDAQPAVNPLNSVDSFLVITVLAKPKVRFASYELLQAITSQGLQFGAMNIFHYYQAGEADNKVLFSLASVNEPGEFDLNKMGSFCCGGLVLFMDMKKVANPEAVFQLMFKTAEHLADDLDGILHADPYTLWNEEVLLQYQQKIGQFETA